MNKQIVLCALSLGLLPACAGGDATHEAVMVSDSAGITIVESSRPVWTEDTAWRVAPDPAVVIGALEGEDAYLLDRVVHALRLSDGRIVVLDGGTQEIRFYDAEGEYLHSVGGRGEGPGEFRGARRLYRMLGDSLFVADGLAARFSVLDPDGRFVRSYAAGRGRASPRGRLADGRLVTWSYSDSELAQANGHVRVPLHLLVYTPDGTREDTVAELPGGEEFRFETDALVANLDAPFAAGQQMFVRGDRIFTGAGDAFEVDVLREDGSSERILRAAVAPRSVTASDVNAWREMRLERAADVMRPAIERLVRDAPVPSKMPAYSALHVDSEGSLWVREYAPPAQSATEWQVFDVEGRWLGGVNLPERFEVTEIGVNYVLGVFRDQYDVEYVRLHPIEKPGA